MGQGGTYPDLAMAKGLELMGNEWKKMYSVKSVTSKNISVEHLKRVIHSDLFASVNMMVTKDIYDVDDKNFVYKGNLKKVGGHSLVCCGYDDSARMLIL